MCAAADPVPYEGLQRFQFSALVQASAAHTEGPWAPAIPWALALTGSNGQELFYLVNTDLLRQLPVFLDRLRALPEGAFSGQEMLNQGLPCYFFVERKAGAAHVNVSAFRDGRDRLLPADIVFPWDEFTALITLSLRHFLHELVVDYPGMRRFLNPPITAFNQWTARWDLTPFEPPADLESLTPSPQAGKGGGRRRSPLAAPEYLVEWRTHKARNQRLNGVLLLVYVGLGMLGVMLPLVKIPLGLWLWPLATIVVPWLLVARYPAIPLHSRLWTPGGVESRVFYLDSALLLSGILIWLVASMKGADILWVWLFPVGWLLCLFCGLGFPLTHWARPLWDWQRPLLLSSILLASLILWLLADLGGVWATSLTHPAMAPPVVPVQRRAQTAVQQWPGELQLVAQPIARFIDEYSNRSDLTQFLPVSSQARKPVAWLARWLWVGGVMTFALGLAWGQLPSPAQVRIHATPFEAGA